MAQSAGSAFSILITLIAAAVLVEMGRLAPTLLPWFWNPIAAAYTAVPNPVVKVTVVSPVPLSVRLPILKEAPIAVVVTLVNSTQAFAALGCKC